MSRRLLLAMALVSPRAIIAQDQTGRSCRAELTRLHVEIPAGASEALIDSASLAPFFDRTISEALAARLAGVSVMQSNGVAGGGSRVRLRGPSGIIGTHQPVLYVNGIRVDGELQSTTIGRGVGLGGYAPSRMDDIPVDDIRCIYVLRGPATTAVYGTDASYGVIHILTREATPASSSMSASLEAGATTDPTTYPANFGDTNSCSRTRAAQGQCTPGTLRAWSPMEAEDPFRVAPLVHANARAAVVRGPRAHLAISGGATLRDGALRINEHRTYNAMASGMIRARSTIDVQGSAWYFGGTARLPLVGNTSLGILSSALLGNSVDDPVRRGYQSVPLSVLEQFDTDESLRRIGGVVRAHWTPVPWLAVAAVAGREDSHVTEEQFWPTFFVLQLPNVSPPSYRVTADQRSQHSSASIFTTLSYGPAAARMTSDIGVSYVDATYRTVGKGVNVVDPNFFGNTYTYDQRDPVNTGLVVRQSLAIHDRVIVDGGVRLEKLTRDYVRLEKPRYPFASAAIVPVRNAGHAWSLLRFRGAYGENGESRWIEGAFLSGVRVPPGSMASLPPSRVERTREIEAGLDIGLVGDRVRLEGTYFQKRTSNGLNRSPIPPGVGGGGETISQSASWENRGFEIGVHARVVDAAFVRAELAVTYTSLENELTSLGGQPPVVGTYSRVTPGYPLYGFWAAPFSVTDQNGDGVIVSAEVRTTGDPRYLGSPVPTRELGVSPRVTFGSDFTVAALIDYRGGFRVLNLGGRLRCNGVCAPIWAPDASIDEQARAVGGASALGAWMEDGTFVRLRELAASWVLPKSFSKRLGARSSQVVLAGRNLLTRTDYSGLEPEGSYTGQSGIEQDELFVLPLPRTISLRLNVGW